MPLIWGDPSEAMYDPTGRTVCGRVGELSIPDGRSTMTDTTQPDIGAWCVLDLFGRQKAAGYLTEVKKAGKDFLRLQIPATNGHQARTIDYNPDAIYSTEFVDEETARLVAAHDRPPEPVSVWSARTMVRSSGSQLALETPADVLEEEDDDDPVHDEGPF